MSSLVSLDPRGYSVFQVETKIKPQNKSMPSLRALKISRTTRAPPLRLFSIHKKYPSLDIRSTPSPRGGGGWTWDLSLERFLFYSRNVSISSKLICKYKKNQKGFQLSLHTTLFLSQASYETSPGKYSNFSLAFSMTGKSLDFVNSSNKSFLKGIGKQPTTEKHFMSITVIQILE